MCKVDIYELDPCISVRNSFEEEELRREIEKLLNEKLTYREREILKLRFIYLGEKMTRKEISKIFNVSGDRIRQVELKALRKLKKYLLILDKE